METKKIFDFIKDNKLVILLGLIFATVLLLVYIGYFFDKNNSPKEDKTIGEIETPIETYDTNVSLEDATIYVARDAVINNWKQTNNALEVIDLASEIEVSELAGKFGLYERGKDDFFEEWVGDWGNLFVYRETIRVNVGKTDVIWDVNKAITDDLQNEYLRKELSDVVAYNFDNILFTSESTEDNHGEVVWKIEGVLKIDGIPALYDGWSDVFVTIIIDKGGMIKYLEIKRFLPDFSRSGVYGGYTQDELLENIRNGDTDQKIFRVNIDLSSSPNYADDGSDSYLIDIQYSDLVIRTITIRGMGMMYYVDKDAMVALPMIVITGDIYVGTGGGVESGIYKVEIWHSNVK